jgi:hypothetical protein
MSWKNHLKEKLADAARRIADSLPTIARYVARAPIFVAGIADYAANGPVVLAATGLQGTGLQGVADSIKGAAGGLATLGAVVGGVLLGVGALIRFLPGTSADLRQTAMKMIEGGIILLVLVGTGSYILQGANWLGQEIGKSGNAAVVTVTQDYLNPWGWQSGSSSGSNTGR